MRRLLWVGDAAVPSGFARATHEVLDVLRETWEVNVLGLAYRGDPHEYPYKIYAAFPGGDALGVGRLIWMMDTFKPDVVVFMNDPWQIPFYTRKLEQFKDEYGGVKRIGYIAVDGRLCQGAALNQLDLSIFWTEFGEREAIAGACKTNTAVIPLGVDAEKFTPGDRNAARLRLGYPKVLLDKFIVGNVNRNQPRKRFDLTIQYFADWVHRYHIDDAFLFLHTAPTGDTGYDCQLLAEYYGVGDRLALVQPPVFYGRSEEEMVDTYRAFDVQVSTTVGEGFGLTTFEGSACGIPQVLPEWSALGEFFEGAAMMVPCSATQAAPDINTIGGIADKEKFIQCLHYLYLNASAREHVGGRCREVTAQPRFRWRNVGEAFRDQLETVL